MNHNQKTFLMYVDSLDVLDELTDEEAGQLFKAIKDYKKGDEIKLPRILKLIFIQFKNYLDRDAEKYQEIVEKKREAGKRGGLAKAKKGKRKKQKVANVADAKSAKHTLANLADNVNDNVNDNDIYIYFEKVFIEAYNFVTESNRSKITGNKTFPIEKLKEHGIHKIIESVVKLRQQPTDYWAYTFSPQQMFRTKNTKGEEVDWIEEFYNLPADKDKIKSIMGMVGKHLKDTCSDELEKVKEFMQNEK